MSKQKPKNKGDQRNPNAVALGALGAKEGGKARAKALPPRKRSEIARKGGKARHQG